MKLLDRLIQRWRIAQARRYVPDSSRVLDIGCADGALFRLIPAIREGVGIDPFIAGSTTHGRYELIKGWFPRDLPGDEPFDVITMLAVLEHVPQAQQLRLAEHCARLLKPGGRLVITVPVPAVDTILSLLRGLHLVDGMSLEQHYGFDAAQTALLFGTVGLTLVRHRRFQLGLNNLFVLEKPVPVGLHNGEVLLHAPHGRSGPKGVSDGARWSQVSQPVDDGRPT